MQRKTMLQELSHLVEILKLNETTHDWRFGRIVIAETADGNFEQLAKTHIIPPPDLNRMVAENLRRIRDESDQPWLIVARSSMDMDRDWLDELTLEVRTHKKTLVFVTSFGEWERWVARLRNMGLNGLHDCSMRFEISSVEN